MKRYSRRRKTFPYYKVQVFDKRSLSWVDKQKAFDTIEQAKSHISKKISPQFARIMVVEEKIRYVLKEE